MTYRIEEDIVKRAVAAINEAIGAMQRYAAEMREADANTTNGLIVATPLFQAIAAHRHIKEAGACVHQIAIAQRRPQAFAMRDLMEQAGTALMNQASVASLSRDAAVKTIDLLRTLAKNIEIMAGSRAPSHAEVVASMGERLFHA